MNVPVWSRPIPLLILLTRCGGSSPSPTGPSAPTSFLTGTWRGTVTIEINPGDSNALPPSSGAMEWTFEVMPQTNLQSFRTTVRSEHAWLTMTTTATTAVRPATRRRHRSPRRVSSTHHVVVEARSEA